MTTRITLNQMRFYAYHGVLEQERKVGNEFVVSVTLTAPLDTAVQNDKVTDTINYADVYEVLEAQMAIPSNLLEHAAGRMLKRLKEHFPLLTEISLTLTKPNPPFGGDLQSASVTLEESYKN
ncbi:MAG: dihydroneopterin aldolase [Massilibacteroides sp.]|nr:dihydroneopterin aldolase [Massilibacteroides sp.]